MLDRIAAEMDRRAAAMFSYAEAMADRTPAGGVAEAAIRGDAAGGPELFLCLDDIRQRRMHAERPDHVARRRRPPRVERHSSGNCGAVAALPAGRSAFNRQLRLLSAPPKQPDLILTRNSGRSPYAGMVRQIASAARNGQRSGGTCRLLAGRFGSGGPVEG